MKKSWVTIITANYNKAPFLKATLESVQRQTYTHVEHVVVDDGSTDGSRDILNAYARENKNVKVILNPKNCGCVARLRNQAVHASRGKFIINLDSDDLLYTDAIESLIKKAEEEILDVCYGAMVYMDEKGSPLGPWTGHGIPYEPGRLIKHMYLSPPRMYRRSLYDQTGGYNESKELRVADDWDLYLQLEEKSRRFGWAGERPLFCYRIIEKSLSNAADREAFRKERETVKRFAMERRKAKRILIIGKSWNEELVLKYRSEGQDVVTFFGSGQEIDYMEQFIWFDPTAPKRSFQVLSILRKFRKKFRKNRFDLILYSGDIPWILRRAVHGYFRKASKQFV
jgi:glycosyltransferase involved in cell wall biosynthesis